jgi:hypothetical protein
MMATTSNAFRALMTEVTTRKNVVGESSGT